VAMRVPVAAAVASVRPASARRMLCFTTRSFP
jgi:hypothetical protein